MHAVFAAQAIDVSRAVRRSAVALGVEQGFAEAFQCIVQRIVALAAGASDVEGGTDAGRLVDGKLFLHCQVQRQMQKGVDLAVFRREVALDRIPVLDQCVIFRVQCDDVDRDRFERRKHFTLTVLAPGVDEKAANLLAGGIEHGRFRRGVS